MARSVSGSGIDSGSDPSFQAQAQAQADAPLPRPTHPGESVAIEIITVNVTSTGPLKKFLDATSAHFVLAQEVKTSGPTSDYLRDWVRRNGRKVLIADASYRPDTNAHSAGVAIFERDWLGLGWPPG